MQVSFIIPLYNCLELTRECVRSLQATLPAGLVHEIILVDDGSSDGTREWLAALGEPFRVVLNEKNLGYAAANNRAASLATAPLLIFSNNDIVFEPHWFEALVSTHQRLASRGGIVGNIQCDAHTREIDHTGIYFDYRAKAQHQRTRGLFSWLYEPEFSVVPAVTGACFAVSRELWQTLGGFDEGYVNGSEDIDLCLRAAALGRLNAVALHSCVRHHVSASAGRKLRDESNSYRFTTRWHHTVAQLAQPAVAARVLERQWLGPRDATDWWIAVPIFLFRYGIMAQASIELILASDAAVRRELARWEKLFHVEPRRFRDEQEPTPNDPTLI